MNGNLRIVHQACPISRIQDSALAFCFLDAFYVARGKNGTKFVTAAATRGRDSGRPRPDAAIFFLAYIQLLASGEATSQVRAAKERTSASLGEKTQLNKQNIKNVRGIYNIQSD